MKLTGLCIHGLMGDFYSLGMDSLASKLNHSTPVGVHFQVIGGNNPSLSQATDILSKANHAGDTIMAIGHSLGGDIVWQLADIFNKTSLKLPLMISIDPVDWTSNSGQPGLWTIPNNVKIGMNYRQPYYPGGGTVYAKSPTDTYIYQHTYPYPHANFGQALAMDTAPDIHASIQAAVLALIARDGK